MSHLNLNKFPVFHTLSWWKLYVQQVPLLRRRRRATPIHLLSQFAALSHALTTQSMAVEHENMLKREWCTEINQQVHTQDDLKRNTKHKLTWNVILSSTEISLHRLNRRRPWRPSTEGWKKNPSLMNLFISAHLFFCDEREFQILYHRHWRSNDERYSR